MPRRPVASAWRSRGAAEKKAPAAESEPDGVRIFRYHAGASAQALRDHVTRATMDDKLRADLLRRIDAHLRRVDDAARREPAANDATRDAVMARGSALGDEFLAALGEWVEKRPAARDAIQRQATIAEAYATALTSEPAAIPKAARAAGLPPGREAEVRKAVIDRRQRLKVLLEASQKQVAGAPPAEAELRDTAAGYDLQLQRMAAAREVRDLVEAMLPRAADRAKLDAAMLRWYEQFEPGEAAEPCGESPRLDP